MNRQQAKRSGKHARSIEPRTLPDSARAIACKQRRTKPFLFSEADGRQFTYAEFDAAVNRAARDACSRRASAKGDVVSLLMPNSAEYIIAYFACWKLGALAGPVNSLLKAAGDCICNLITQKRKRCWCIPSFCRAIESIRDELPHLKSVITFDDEAEATREFDATTSQRAASTPRLAYRTTKQSSSTPRAPPENQRAVCSLTAT